MSKELKEALDLYMKPRINGVDNKYYLLAGLEEGNLLDEKLKKLGLSDVRFLDDICPTNKNIPYLTFPFYIGEVVMFTPEFYHVIRDYTEAQGHIAVISAMKINSDTKIYCDLLFPNGLELKEVNRNWIRRLTDIEIENIKQGKILDDLIDIKKQIG